MRGCTLSRSIAAIALTLGLLSAATGGAGSPIVRLIDANVSPLASRDGTTVTIGYRIESSEPIEANLSARFNGPIWDVIEDMGGQEPVSIAQGTNWYYRDFFINAPHNAWTHWEQDATWTVRWAPDGEASLTRTHYFRLLPTVPVRVAILMYHKIGPDDLQAGEWWVKQTTFREHLTALKAYGYTPITLQELMDYRAGLATAPPKPMIITFDDGYENLLTHAFPVLSDPAINSKATAFLSTGRMGGTNAWDTGDNIPLTNHLTWEQVSMLDATGMIDFQAHTVSHAVLTSLTGAALDAELVGSKQEIEARLGKPIRFFAYPYGQASGAVAEAARKAGYFAAVTAAYGVDPDSVGKFSLWRVPIYRHTSVEYDSARPENFLFGPSTVSDPDVVVPEAVFDSVELLDPLTNTPLPANEIIPGGRVKVRATVTNAGPAAEVIAGLRIDSDPEHATGIIYDSHLDSPTGDIAATLGQGQQTFEWTWQAPITAPTGQYHVYVHLRDRYYVLGFGNSGWVSAFQVTPPVLPMPIRKIDPVGTPAAATHVVVTATEPDYFYVQSPGGLLGIRVVRPGHGLSAGAQVSLTGSVERNASGELYIAASAVTQTGTGSVRPLGMGTSAIGGGPSGSQEGVWNWQRERGQNGATSLVWKPAHGPNNIGLLIRTWGRVESVDATSGTLVISDGSGNSVKCRLIGGGTLDPGWTSVVVTGVVSCEKVLDQIRPLVLATYVAGS